MAPLMVVGYLKTSGKIARQKVIEELSKVMSFSEKNEPGVSKYCLTVPQSAEDEQSVYVIEEYKDQAALDSHMASPAVSTLISLFNSDPTLLQAAPKVHNLHPVASFTRPEASHHENPYIVFATLDYKPGTRSQGVSGFSTVCKETEKNEPETLSYNILEDKENDNLVQTLEVYETEKYLWDRHAKSNAVSENKEKNGSLRNSTNFVFLKRAGGYLWKADVKRAMM